MPNYQLLEIETAAGNCEGSEMWSLGKHLGQREGSACANDYHGNEEGLHPQTGPLLFRRALCLHQEGCGFVYKAAAASRLEQASDGTLSLNV